MPITALPPVPQRNEPATFAEKADVFLAALPQFQSEANDLIGEYAAAASAAANVEVQNYISEAVAAKDLAVAAWSASTAPAEQLAAVDTAFFPVTTLVTARLFSTRDDFDGGAWRKKCQDKSWYTETIYGRQIGVGYYANETAARAVSGSTTNDYYYDTTAGLFKALNAGSGTTTIYRGGRREFPENFIVTLSTHGAIIWDCDFGAPRMWKVFAVGTTKWYYGATTEVAAIAYKSRVLALGTKDTSGSLFIANFVSDTGELLLNSATYNYIAQSLSLRNASYIGSTTGGLRVGTKALVSRSVNAVAITTLPNAPLDEYGVPKPTIAVGTDGGVTVLGWDGVQDNVAWDIVVTTYSSVAQVGFDNHNRLYFTASNTAGSASWLFSGPIPTADVSFAYNSMPSGYSSVYGTGDTDQTLVLFPGSASGGYAKINPVAGNYAIRAINSAGNQGLEIFRENPATPTNGMGAKITHTYNTGMLVGDIRRSWLSDTVAETIAAATPMSDDFSGYADDAALNAAWSTSAAYASGVATLSSGKMLLTTTGTFGKSKSFATIVGSTYSVRFDKPSSSVSAANAYIRVSTSASGATGVIIDVGNTAASGSFTGSFVATATTTYVVAICVVSGSAEFDNISVKLAEPDRCAKNKAITVVGSLTKSAVASGANLVAYSGFSATNYLEEAYSSDLDFGTGTHGRVFWLKENANSAQETIFQRDSASTAQRVYAHVNASGTITFGCDDNTTDRAATSTVTVDDGLWHLYWMRYDGAGGVYIYRDGSSTPIASATGTALLTLSNTSAYVRVGVDSAAANPLTNGSLVLKRVSATDMSMQQWAEMYELEKKLFEPNAQCTLAGTSSSVLAVDYDHITGVISAPTSYGRNDIKGLVRVASEATAVGTPKAVSSLGGAILQVGSTGIDYYAPAKNLREELPTYIGEKPRQLFDFDLSSATTCTLPLGWKPTGAVWSAGAKKRYGAAKDFLISYDGFLWSVVMHASTTAWVQVEGEQQ